MIEADTVTMSKYRFAELLVKEERLRLLENALRMKSGYTDIDYVKTIFNLKEKGNQE